MIFGRPYDTFDKGIPYRCKWFAWYPVRLDQGQYAWLEVIYYYFKTNSYGKMKR